MYSTCIFCARDLGENEVLESFPVGRRLAFDAARGRLWVVCPRCERWNLTPLEDRWEAIEQSERLFRMATRRISTEQIGLARLREGTELVRVGRPLRPEYAAWRYGDQFGGRRRRKAGTAVLGAAGLGTVALAPAALGLTVTGFGFASGLAISSVVLKSEQVIARFRTATRGVIRVRRKHLRETRLLQGGDAPLAIDVRYSGGRGRFEGREALRMSSILMAHANRYGASRGVVENAARAIDRTGGPEGYLEHLAPNAEDYTWIARGWMAKRMGGLLGLPSTDRLALEMALHEEAEERALRGELAELEHAWRDAEEIAAIADGLFHPSAMTERIERLRRS